MKTNDISERGGGYIAPSLETMELTAEKGFQVSIVGMDDGGDVSLENSDWN